MTIYLHGCSGCGITGVYLRRVLRFMPDAEVVNTKYETNRLDEHAGYLKMAGINTDNYPAIVVDDDVTRLEKWKPL